MIPFREITIEDKPQVDSIICASGCHGADYSFANMFIWRHAYQPRIHFEGGRIIVSMPHGDEILYAYPKGDGNIKQAVDLMLDDAHERGQKLVMRGLTQFAIDELMPVYGDKFEIIEVRDDADYCYTVEKLSKLVGRKLASKRNHIKHFEKNGEWEVSLIGDYFREGLLDSSEKPITSASIENAKDFVAKFYDEKNDPSLVSEKGAIKEMFDNFDRLGFIGALLKQNGEYVAFTAGTRLGNYAVDVHFEKAIPGVDGAYPMINREFANIISQLFPEVEMLNREEDMGLEGLRKAKLSYYPDLLMLKYVAKEK